MKTKTKRTSAPPHLKIVGLDMNAVKLNWDEWCKATRAEKGFSQNQAALQIAGLSLRTWQDWEAGRSEPPSGCRT